MSSDDPLHVPALDAASLLDERRLAGPAVVAEEGREDPRAVELVALEDDERAVAS